MSLFTNYYEILHLIPSASFEDIKTAFRKQAMIHHPDKHANSPESNARFRLIHEAYSVLSDPQQREQYDIYLRTSAVINRMKSGGLNLLPGDKGRRFDSPEIILGNLNIILWDIEELMNYKNHTVWNQLLGEYRFWENILMVLLFIDRWVFEPAGFPDYYRQARKLDKVDFARYRDLYFGDRPDRHKPYVDVTDYFYDIRKRADKMIGRITASDFNTPIPECDVTLIDCIFEAYRFAVYTVGYLNKAVKGEIGDIPSFPYSGDCFDM